MSDFDFSSTETLVAPVRATRIEHHALQEGFLLERMEAFSLAINDVLYQMSADWSVMYGLKGSSVLADTETADPALLEKYIHPLDQPRVVAAIQQSIATRTKFELEHRVLQADGTLGWTFSRAIPVLSPDGEIEHWLGAANDISARKRAEEEVREGREQLLLAMEAAGLAAWSFDPSRNLVWGDATMQRLFGLSVPEAPVEVWIAAIFTEDRERVASEYADALTGKPYDTEYRIAKGGTVCWVRAKATLTSAPDEPARLVGVCEDISTRKAGEIRLRSTLERLTLAEQIGNIAVWEWDLGTGKFLWDSAGALVYGRPIEELDHIDAVLPLIEKEDLPSVMHGLEPVLKGSGEFSHEFRVCWPDGSMHWLVGKGIAMRDESGVVSKVTGVNINVTERRNTEAALRQSEKLAAVGQLASTIAHEINNPLESVTNLLYLAKTSPHREEILSYLNTAEVELRRVSAITGQTLRFHRQQSRAREVRSEELLEDALMIYEGRIRNAGIEIELRLDAKASLFCLEGEIRQVLNNLIGNAVDAMANGGKLILHTADVTDWRSGRQGLRITVADTGTGMTPVTLKNIFEPFFTTKGFSGTGLGLWISKDIVERHEGKLSVRSCMNTVQHGTVFTMILPVQAVSDPHLAHTLSALTGRMFLEHRMSMILDQLQGTCYLDLTLSLHTPSKYTSPRQP